MITTAVRRFVLVLVLCVTTVALAQDSRGLDTGADADGGRLLFLDVVGHKVRVQLTTKEALYFIDPVTGQQLPRYTIKDGIRIADALRAAGLEDYLTKVLIGARFGEPRKPAEGVSRQVEPQETQLFINVQKSKSDLFEKNKVRKIQIPMVTNPNRVVLDPTTGERFRWFTVDEGNKIRAALDEQGLGIEELVPVLLDSRLPFQGTEKACHLGPLAPECGQCQNGMTCNWGGELDCCCDGASVCQKCKICQ